MNGQSRHHTWLIVVILIIGLSACTTTPSPTTSNQPTPSPTTPSPTTPTQTTPSPTTPTQTTPSPTTPSPTTPSSTTPTQTLATFCTDMEQSNNAAAETQFTSPGWLQFQPPPPSPPRKGYAKCNFDSVTILTNTTARVHLIVTTMGNNQTYSIDVTLILVGNSWKINTWVSHKQSADAPAQSYLG